MHARNIGDRNSLCKKNQDLREITALIDRAFYPEILPGRRHAFGVPSGVGGFPVNIFSAVIFPIPSFRFKACAFHIWSVTYRDASCWG